MYLRDTRREKLISGIDNQFSDSQPVPEQVHHAMVSISHLLKDNIEDIISDHNRVLDLFDILEEFKRAITTTATQIDQEDHHLVIISIQK